MTNNEMLISKYSLNKNEASVMALIMNGENNQEIADGQGRSLSWTKSIVSVIFDKVGVRDRSQLMARMWQEGWGFKTPVVQDSLLPRGRNL